MKIALIYSGQPRHVKECHANHVKTFYDANPGTEIDVFAHIWDHEKMVGKELGDRQKNYLRRIWQPKEIVFEEPREFSFENEGIQQVKMYQRNPQEWKLFLNNMASMFYSMEQANNLKKLYEINNSMKYDFVIRLRTDVYFLHNKYSPKLVGNLSSYDMNSIHVHSKPIACHYGINDQFSFGPSEMMDKYFEIYSNFTTITKMGSLAIAESMLGFNVNKIHKLPTKGHAWDFILYRYIPNRDYAKSSNNYESFLLL